MTVRPDISCRLDESTPKGLHRLSVAIRPEFSGGMDESAASGGHRLDLDRSPIKVTAPRSSRNVLPQPKLLVFYWCSPKKNLHQTNSLQEKALASQAEGRGFDPHHPLQTRLVEMLCNSLQIVATPTLAKDLQAASTPVFEPPHRPQIAVQWNPMN